MVQLWDRHSQRVSSVDTGEKALTFLAWSVSACLAGWLAGRLAGCLPVWLAGCLPVSLTFRWRSCRSKVGPQLAIGSAKGNLYLYDKRNQQVCARAPLVCAVCVCVCVCVCARARACV